MEQPNDRVESSNSGQPFDILFKEIVEQHVHDILPIFLPGAVYEETLDTEQYVQNHVTSMYPLLPTMQGVN